jgi:hypothetical protein
LATTEKRTLSAPPFFCHLPGARHDYPGRADAGAAGWMLRHGFRREGDWLPKMKAGWHTACCMPYVQERFAELITCVMYWAGPGTTST